MNKPIAAQPQQPSAEPLWESELFKYIWVTDGQLLCNPEKLAGVIQRIRNEGHDSALNSVRYIRCLKHTGSPQYNKDEYGQECTECAVQDESAKLATLQASHAALKLSLGECVKALESADNLIDELVAQASGCMAHIGVGDRDQVWVRKELRMYGNRMKQPIDAALATARKLVGTSERPQTNATPTPSKRSCNRHHDCDAAEAEVLAKNPGKTISFSFHCHDEDCEDCFGC
jgi:hypothetical protein